VFGLPMTARILATTAASGRSGNPPSPRQRETDLLDRSTAYRASAVMISSCGTQGN
jgi:hypothetical protein